MHHRRIRSFVKRETRLTPAQARALESYLPLYGIERTDAPIDLATLLPYESIILEIGFGKGESLFEQAQKNPDTGFIGVEVHRPGVGQFLNRIHKAGLKNVRVCNQDVVEFLSRLSPASLSGVQIFFPDPWQKARHHKRRLIQASLLDTLFPLLKTGGFIHCATDWEDYAMSMRDVFAADPRFKNASETGFIPRPDRTVSSFEARGLRLGHQTWDIWVVGL
ncbi:MAG: tRNA (guanosine(46)-N7)-methyltransferase TrmB [Gammaproteobacteria bacterium]